MRQRTERANTVMQGTLVNMVTAMVLGVGVEGSAAAEEAVSAEVRAEEVDSVAADLVVAEGSAAEMTTTTKVRDSADAQLDGLSARLLPDLVGPSRRRLANGTVTASVCTRPAIAFSIPVPTLSR